jgi:glycosyltransferase involved in cell wall biosynthesis
VLKIWNVTVGEPIIEQGSQVRLHRAGQMCNWLSCRGHDVTFVNSTFNHQNRCQRFSKTTTIEISANLRVVCLQARGYEKSVSFARFASHRDCARSFGKWLQTEPQNPDVIIVSYPVVELCLAALNFAELNAIPVLIDCRDFWPDIFSEVLPLSLRWMGKLFFFPFEMQTRRMLARATAISGHTESALQWGLDKAGRDRNNFDFFFPFTFPDNHETEQGPISNKPFSNNEVRICFIGTISHRSGLEKYIRALGSLPKEMKLNIKLLIAGTGSHASFLEGLVNSYDAPVEFLGWIDRQQIIELMHGCDFGLLPYDLPDFHLSLPNKLVDYVRGGLPILSCTRGEVKRFIEFNSAGVWTETCEVSISEQLMNFLTMDFSFNRMSIRKIYDEQFAPDKVFRLVEKVVFELNNNRKEELM